MASLKFYKVAGIASENLTTGGIYFDKNTGIIHVATSATTTEKYGSHLLDATWNETTKSLEVVKNDGSKFSLNLSDVASASAMEAALALKADKTQVAADIAAATADMATNAGVDGKIATVNTAIENAKNELAGQISGKNVSAEGDSLISASAANNKVTVAATTALSEAVAKANSALQAADKAELSEAIAAEASRAAGVEGDLETRLKAVEDGKADSATVTDLSTTVAGHTATLNSILGNTDETDLNSIAELAAWIEEHGTEAAEMAASITANAAAIAAEATTARAAEQANATAAANAQVKADEAYELAETRQTADQVSAAISGAIDSIGEKSETGTGEHVNVTVTTEKGEIKTVAVDDSGVKGYVDAAIESALEWAIFE